MDKNIYSGTRDRSTVRDPGPFASVLLPRSQIVPADPTSPPNVHDNDDLRQIYAVWCMHIF